MPENTATNVLTEGFRQYDDETLNGLIASTQEAHRDAVLAGDFDSLASVNLVLEIARAEAASRAVATNNSRDIDIDEQVTNIQNRDQLAAFADQYGLRYDWHEPDESGISARFIGTHLDNAMGSTTRAIGEGNSSGEFNVILTHDGEAVAVVNLSTVLSWAARA